MITLNTEMFSYKDKVFAGEISTTQLSIEDLKQQVFDDACDEGFLLESERTGKTIRMVFSKQHTNGEDITHWTFEPYIMDILREPVKFECLELFND